mmetsp:Transcript_53115/g.168597  ORF Transcript_53115/g.168597 Transcript_53115/m.168597 type:complete len:373 (-) Transcript_53115:164-1282(-)|eukprot:CAMPEP_0182912532 /NCGR_PEP_ID=MMETSP0034_2-20130328/37562_1 /TAXON_ID=156128 /ORGANISM="Nephroselmis pyriformis, Strain CCMP717" /LENGTH=372 /DNA_ID=CAMNT_0025049207 /DNA_START=24 /DNA_END=1142 /DNA_ORIENTATION=+
MGPKKGDAAAARAAQKAAEEKRQQKANDRTFGLKNKNKSKTVQRYINEVQTGVTATSQKANRMKAERDAATAKKKKEAEAEAAREMAKLMGPKIKQPEVPPGVDPKSIVCEFYRKGVCSKPAYKCKFSHDLSVERKTQKIDIYSDRRDDNMEDWDQDKLEDVINKMHSGENANRPTDIICKHFLDAVEKKTYGWFWVCPDGGKECKYRHALPPGYQLKSQIKALEAEARASKKSVEEEIEEARKKLDASTPVNEETFRAWKKKKVEEKAAKVDAERSKRLKGGQMTGRELFESEGFVAVDDDCAGGADAFKREDDFEAEWKRVQAESEANLAKAKAGITLSAEDAALFADDDDELDEAELAEIEKGLEKAKV